MDAWLLNVRYSNQWLVAIYKYSNQWLVAKYTRKITHGWLLKSLAMMLIATNFKGC
jgi:hypothetical protein